VCFGDQTQFVLTAENAMTPRTAKFTAATVYDVDLNCRPINAENLIYFGFSNGDYAGIREYFVDTKNGQTKDGDSITAHVPKYLSGSPRRMGACLTEDIMCVATEGVLDSLFVYKWYWQDDSKLQSSWSKWNFGQPGQTTVILGFEFIGPTLHLVIGRGAETFLETMRVDSPLDSGIGYAIHLDRRVNSASGAYDAVTDTTPLTIAYNVDFGDPAGIVTANSGPWKIGQSIKVVSKAGNTITFKGNIVGVPLMIGLKYTTRFRFSPAQVLGQTVTGGIAAHGNGRLQVRTWSVTYKDTGYFRAEVTPAYCDTVSNEFTGRVLGSSLNLIGEFPLETGRFKFLVNAKNDLVTIDLVNDSHMPSCFVSAEWEGTYHAKSQKV
jgi:hypothetical protein